MSRSGVCVLLASSGPVCTVRIVCTRFCLVPLTRVSLSRSFAGTARVVRLPPAVRMQAEPLGRPLARALDEENLE